jgi:hypothetical protein
MVQDTTTNNSGGLLEVVSGDKSIKFDLEFTNKTIAQISIAAVLCGILLVIISKKFTKWV